MSRNIIKINDTYQDIDNKYFENYGGEGYSKVYQDYTSSPEEVISTLLDNNIIPKTILDAGCASGELVRDFRKLGIKAYGIEKNNEILKRNVIPEYCCQMDIKDLSTLKPNTFDVIFCNALMYFWPKEIPTILKSFCKITNKAVWFCNPYLEDPYFEDSYRKFLASKAWWENEFKKAGFHRKNRNLYLKKVNYLS